MRNIAQMPRRWETIRELISPSLIFSIPALLAALFLGVALSAFSPIYGIAVAGAVALVIIILLRLNELTVMLIVAAHIFLDSYLNLDVYQVAMLMSLVLLSACYFGRSADHPWIGPRSLWLWVVFLILNIYPTISGGAFSLTNAIAFYLNLVFSACIMFWLGNIIARDISSVRRTFQLLSILTTFIAVHTIIQAVTGKFLFETANAAATIAQYSNFQAAGASGISRAGSFLSNPDNNGNFLAPSFFLPLGLFMESKQLLLKVIYLLEMLLILLALMFTYSTGSWIAVLAGIAVFMFMAGRIRNSVLLLILTVTLVVMASIVFSSQISAQLNHANNQSDLADHLGTWQTAARVIEAYPLTGVGLGDQAYLVQGEPFRVFTQRKPQSEPDNSFLEWGAVAGIPVMVVFLSLLGYVFWFSWRNWRSVEIWYRPLLGGGIAALIALSVNSLTNDGWTDPAGVAIFGWLIAGLVASPLIDRCLRQQSVPPVTKTTEIVSAHNGTSRMNKIRWGL